MNKKNLFLDDLADYAAKTEKFASYLRQELLDGIEEINDLVEKKEKSHLIELRKICLLRESKILLLAIERTTRKINTILGAINENLSG